MVIALVGTMAGISGLILGQVGLVPFSRGKSALLLLACLGLIVGTSDAIQDWSKRPASAPKTTQSARTPSIDMSVVMAWTACQDFVRDRLKSPSTAKYQRGVASDFVRRLGSGMYEARAWVDSQNSFGATLRTNFECVVRDAGNDTWRLERMSFRN